MISQNTQHSAPSSPKEELEANLPPNSSPKSLAPAADTLVQDDKISPAAECLNMGSIDQVQNVNVEEQPEAPKEPENQIPVQENTADRAETVPQPAAEDEKLSEKEGKNVGGPNVHTLENQLKKEDQKTLSTIAQPSQVAPEDLANLAQPSKNEAGDATNAAQPSEITANLNADENTNKGAPEDQPMTEEEADKPKSATSSPRKNGSNEGDNRSPSRNQGNSFARQNIPKRVLRDRKPRATRNADAVSKCHI